MEAVHSHGSNSKLAPRDLCCVDRNDMHTSQQSSLRNVQVKIAHGSTSMIFPTATAEFSMGTTSSNALL